MWDSKTDVQARKFQQHLYKTLPCGDFRRSNGLKSQNLQLTMVVRICKCQQEARQKVL